MELVIRGWSRGIVALTPTTMSATESPDKLLQLSDIRLSEEVTTHFPRMFYRPLFHVRPTTPPFAQSPFVLIPFVVVRCIRV